MKKWLPAIVLLCGLVAVTWFYHTTPPSARPPEETGSASNSAAATPVAPAVSNVAVATAPSNLSSAEPATGPLESATAGVTLARAGQAKPLEYTNLAAEIVLRNVRAAVTQYNSKFGGNPVGTNPEITAQLGGRNPAHINFINADAGMRVNDQGELVDPWGTPYFFHQLSANDMEIHSAGPDKIMWTDDDLVTK